MAKLSTKKKASVKRVIVYGPSFAGKSYLVGKLAEHYRLIWVDIEKGHGVLYQLPEAWQENIEIVDLPDTRSYPIGIETVLKIVKGPVDICEEHGKCSCMLCKKNKADFVHVDVTSMTNKDILVIDTMTQLSNSCIANITKGKPDDYKLDYDDWGNLGKLLDIVLSHIQQANYNVIVISHENEVTTEGKKTTLAPTGGTRNFSRNITKYFTDVVYVERKNKKHMIMSSTTGSTTILAGSQSGIAVENYDEPSLLPIFRPDLAPAVVEKPKAGAKKTPTKPTPKAVAKSEPTGGKAASSILEKIRAAKEAKDKENK